MGNAHLDRVSTLECKEKGGVVRSLTRLATVTNLNTSDYHVLLEGLSAAGIPTVPATLDGFPSLVLDERHIKIVNDDPGTADVTLVYNHVLDTDIQELGNSGTGIVRSKSRSTVVQKTTNLEPDLDSEDPLARKQITVQHTYPGPGDKNPDPKYPNQTVVQGGTINIFVPQENIQFGGYVTTPDPDIVTNSLLAMTNSKVWRGAPPRTWLCTESAWRWAGGSRYYFNFEFQYNADTWDPTVVFQDPRTNKPPVGLVEGVGYRRIMYLTGVDFDQIFGSFFEGLQEIS